MKEHLLDLSSGFTFEKSKVEEYFQIIALDKNKTPVYYIYLKPNYSISEVVYSRLSEELELPCVRAFFGTNLKDVNSASDIYSVSSYSHEWKRADENEIKDKNYYRHRVLYFLFTGAADIEDVFGNIKPDGKFISSHNSKVFSALMLHKLYLDGKPTSATFETMDKYDFILESKQYGIEEGEDILEKISNLTDEQISKCSLMPDEIENKSVIEDYLRDKIASTRKLAADCFQLIRDNKGDS